MRGDRVLVQKMSERGGPGKLWPYWENEVHVLVEQKDKNIPVYEVRPESGAKKFSVTPKLAVALYVLTCG